MSARVVKFFWADELKKIEDEMKRFEDSVMRVVQTGEIAGIKIVVEDITMALEKISLETKRNTESITKLGSGLYENTNAIDKISSVLKDNWESIVGTQVEVENIRTQVDENKGAIEDLEQQSNSALLQMYERPSLTPFFAGLEEELKILKQLLESFRACAIMQYSGVGKTQLAVAFVEQMENEGLITGGSFWVSVHGSESKSVSSLVNFAEAL